MGQKKQIHCDEVKKKKKMNTWGEFCRLEEFKTNKRMILFCRELASRSRNLNQHTSRNLLEV